MKRMFEEKKVTYADFDGRILANVRYKTKEFSV